MQPDGVKLRYYFIYRIDDLKYLRFTTLVSKYKWIRKSEFVPKT